jgi:hypothetical protein
MFMFVTASIVCGYGLDAGLLLVPVATLYAVTQLRASMPGAPAGFGKTILSHSMPSSTESECNSRC